MRDDAVTEADILIAEYINEGLSLEETVQELENQDLASPDILVALYQDAAENMRQDDPPTYRDMVDKYEQEDARIVVELTENGHRPAKKTTTEKETTAEK